MRFRIVWIFLLTISLIGGYTYVSSRINFLRNFSAAPKNFPADEPQSSDVVTSAEEPQVVGPLAQFMREYEADHPAPGNAAKPRKYVPNPQDKVLRRPTSAPENFLHSTFAVKDYAAFKIQLPPGTTSAAVKGSFECFTKLSDHEKQPADVQVLLFDEAGYRGLLHGTYASPLQSTEPIDSQSLEWLVDADYKQAKNYYLVFSDPGLKSKLKLVKANFTVQYN